MFRSRGWPNEKFFKFIAKRFFLFLRSADNSSAHRNRQPDYEHEAQFSFHAAAAQFIRPIPGAQLDSFGCQLRNSPTENFRSANAPCNLVARDQSAMSPRQEFFENRTRLEYCHLRESVRRPY